MPKVFNRPIKVGGHMVEVNEVELRVLEYDGDSKILLCTGTTVPTADSSGFAKGCLFIKTDAADGTKGLYENQGTTSESDFNLVGEISGSELGVTAGTVEASKALVAGASDNETAVLDFSSMTLAEGARVIRCSSLDFEATTGWMYFSGNTTTGFRYATYFQPETDGDAKILGHGMFPYIKAGGASDRMQALSTVMSVEGTLEDRNGDPGAGAHNVWAKFGADLSSATIESGARIAPIWSDIQINNGDVSGEEVFGMLISAGGSGIRSLFRWEGTANATYLLETENDTGNGFMAAQADYEGCNNHQQAANLTVKIKNTVYGIPLMATS